MDFQVLGIGPLELVFFVVLLLLLFGPKDLAGMARNIGRFLNRLTRSENFQVVQQASRELRELPQRLVKEAQLEELQGARQAADQAVIASRTPPPAAARPAAPTTPFQAWTQELPPSAVPQPPPPPAPPGGVTPAPVDPFAAWTQELPPAAPPPPAGDKPQ